MRNAAPWLPVLLAGLAREWAVDFELIAIDDNSRDGVRASCWPASAPTGRASAGAFYRGAGEEFRPLATKAWPPATRH